MSSKRRNALNQSSHTWPQLKELGKLGRGEGEGLSLLESAGTQGKLVFFLVIPRYLCENQHVGQKPPREQSHRTIPGSQVTVTQGSSVSMVTGTCCKLEGTTSQTRQHFLYLPDCPGTHNGDLKEHALLLLGLFPPLLCCGIPVCLQPLIQ